MKYLLLLVLTACHLTPQEKKEVKEDVNHATAIILESEAHYIKGEPDGV